MLAGSFFRFSQKEKEKEQQKEKKDEKDRVHGECTSHHSLFVTDDYLNGGRLGGEMKHQFT
jgi:hypothetical protein